MSTGKTRKLVAPENTIKKNGMNKYTVRIIMDELEICAESEDKANEIAQNILESDARTHLNHGCFIAGFETDLIEEDVDEEETEV